MSSYKSNQIELAPLKFDSLNLLDAIKIVLVGFIIIFSIYVSIGTFKNYNNLFIIWGVVFASFLYITYIEIQFRGNKVLYILYHILFTIAAVIFIIVAYINDSNYKDWLLVELSITILMIMMFVFITLPKKTLVFLYHYILNYRFFNATNSDFYTNSFDYDMLIEDKKLDKDNRTIFVITTKVNQKKKIEDKKLELIKQYYAKLIYFWYAKKFEKVLLRFILPIWSVVFGIIFFIVILALLDNIDDIAQVNVVRMSFVVLFLTILFMSMIYQVNNTLDARGYMKHINRSFKSSNINFRDIKPSQRVLLFFDKTFMVYIYDTKFDRRVVLNDSKSFEHFILKADLDKEGRDNIASIFVTLFIVVYIEIFAQVLSDSKTDRTIEDINKTINKLEHNIEILRGEYGEKFNKK